MGNHHVAVHEDVWNALVDARENGRTHGDVWNEMAGNQRLFEREMGAGE